MIRYALICAKGHEFESWFPNSAGYDKQVKRGLVTCPSCGSAKVEKAIMAPQLTSGTSMMLRSLRPHPPVRPAVLLATRQRRPPYPRRSP